MEEKKTTLETFVGCALYSMGGFLQEETTVHFKIPVWFSRTYHDKQEPEEIISFSNIENKDISCPPAYIEFDVTNCKVTKHN